MRYSLLGLAPLIATVSCFYGQFLLMHIVLCILVILLSLRKGKMRASYG